jgi:hypothetical protein
MTFPEGSDLNANVRNNNNIVWKNVTVLEEASGGRHVAYVTVGNHRKTAAPVRLSFDVAKHAPPTGAGKARKTLFDLGTIQVHLGDKLGAKLKKPGSRGAPGLKISAGHQVEVTKAGTSLHPVKLAPNEQHTIKIEFHPKSKTAQSNEVFHFRVIQHASDGKTEKVVGGQTFVLKQHYTKKK